MWGEESLFSGSSNPLGPLTTMEAPDSLATPIQKPGPTVAGEQNEVQHFTLGAPNHPIQLKLTALAFAVATDRAAVVSPDMLWMPQLQGSLAPVPHIS